MSIFFNVPRQRELAEAYGDAAQVLTRAASELAPLVSAAHELLDSGQAGAALHDFESSATELVRDQRDLVARVHGLVEADERTAYLLASTTGRILERRLADLALDEGWTYTEALLREELAELRNRPGPHTREIHQRIGEIGHQIRRLDLPSSAGGSRGDLDWSLLDSRVGMPLQIATDIAVDRGRKLLVRALEDTADPDQILPDEFQVFFHDNGNLTFVLAGVTDLSDLQHGYDPDNNTLRDLDQQAFDSFLSTSLADNEYGQRISEWTEEMIATGVVEQGTTTTIIGHSFGGDTAFDLAADPHFNGDLLHVANAFSAAYSNISKFEAVPEQTRAVAIRNIWDAVTLAERQAEVADRTTRERLAVEVIEAGANGAATLVDNMVDGFEADLQQVGVGISIPPLPEVDILSNSARSAGANGLTIEFEGSFTGAGHHQDAYIQHLESAEQPQLLELFEQLDSQGFTADAVAISVDITRPEPDGA